MILDNYTRFCLESRTVSAFDLNLVVIATPKYIPTDSAEGGSRYESATLRRSCGKGALAHVLTFAVLRANYVLRTYVPSPTSLRAARSYPQFALHLQLCAIPRTLNEVTVDIGVC